MYGYGFERRGVSYDTLYGKELTLAEQQAQQALRKAQGYFSETEHHQPWHCGWQREAKGGSDMSGEWQFYGSYSCEKTIRPSYDRDMVVRLVVQVGGVGKKKRGQGWKYNRWSAGLRCGLHGSSFYGRKYAQSCNSVASACRKAEKLPFIDEEVDALLKRVFSPACAQAVLRYDPRACEFVPFTTELGIAGSPHDWPIGKYFRTAWRKLWQGADKGKWIIDGTSVDVGSFGYGSGGSDVPGLTGYDYKDKYRLVHKAMVESLGCWLPEPKDQTT